MAGSTGVENSGKFGPLGDGASAMFDLCKRAVMQARALQNNGQTEDSDRVFRSLFSCNRASQNRCPRWLDCQRQLKRNYSESQDSPVGLFDWDRMERLAGGKIDIGGRSIAYGFEELISAHDQWGNKIFQQRISLDILARHQSPSMRELFKHWLLFDKPTLSDFDTGFLRSAGIIDWLHVFEFANDGTSRFKRYAPNMVEISGKDYTNTRIQDFELNIFVELHEHLHRELMQSEQPYYGFSARKRRLAAGATEAAMHRLELPYFERNKVAGSIVLLEPQL